MKSYVVAGAVACLSSVLSALGATRAAEHIEPHVQRIAHEALVRSVEKSDTAWCVVMRVKDGAPVAFAECGEVDGYKKPLAATRLVEPGHTITPLTAAIAIDSGIASSNTMISTSVDDGLFAAFRLPKTPHGTNEVSLAEAVINSSNTAFSKLGIVTGADKLYEGYVRFGIGGQLRTPGKWTLQERARIPEGQGIRVSALEMSRAYAILARRGMSEAGEVISRDTAGEVVSMLEEAVVAGSGKMAAIDGVRVAGKTGSLYVMKDWKHTMFAPMGLFAGFFPVEAPEYVIVVICESKDDTDRKQMYKGGGKAALAFKAIAEGILSPPAL